MLFILTGDIQTGKTRWLETLVDSLESGSTPVLGVLAPGVWRSGDEPDAVREHVDANGFEKLGIDNVLLPQHERIPFARRRDIAEAEGLLDPDAQSEKAQLFWHIDEKALVRVNDHLAALPDSGTGKPGLLVIDELGRLEFLRGGGLTEALRLLDKGPTEAFPHALVIVREALLDEARNRFPLWGEPTLVYPDERARKRIESFFGTAD